MLYKGVRTHPAMCEITESRAGNTILCAAVLAGKLLVVHGGRCTGSAASAAVRVVRLAGAGDGT